MQSVLAAPCTILSCRVCTEPRRADPSGPTTTPQGVIIVRKQGKPPSGFHNSHHELTLLELGKGCRCRGLWRVVVGEVVLRLGDLEGSRLHQVELL